jgi:L-ascorbate metabolism protein UlaG (beta-lactamase superfamily)
MNPRIENISFSGYGRYGPHFKEIGEKYGLFDLAMIECGQYKEKWSEIHMMPEESAQAGVDVRAKKVIPIHWRAFTLALHAWTDPVERFLKKSEELNSGTITPQIGEPNFIGNQAPEYSIAWWTK